MTAIYNKIGTTYSKTRRADSRIVEHLVELLELPAGSRILDVGAGTGTYARALAEKGFEVTAIEPSTVMIDQADSCGGVNWVEGSAESLPFNTPSFDAAIYMLCIHHFTNPQKAFEEVRRVVPKGPVVIFTYDPEAIDTPWLFDYFPVFRSQIQKSFPTVEAIKKNLASDVTFSVTPFLLPHDLSDGFAGAAWRYPERYLDKEYRDGTSAFRQLDPELCSIGLSRLDKELESGDWDVKYSAIRSMLTYDHGYTFIKSLS